MNTSLNNFLTLLEQNTLLFYLFLAWSLFWKGIALWKAARNNHRYWFLALLILNFGGVLEILYVFVFSKRKKEDQQKVSQETEPLEEKSEEKDDSLSQ